MIILEEQIPAKVFPAKNVSVSELIGVGPRTVENLAELGIHSFQDLLFHLPARYQDRTKITTLRLLQVGQFALVEGEVCDARLIRARRVSLSCRLVDDSGFIHLRFFHFNAQQLERFNKPGLRLRCFGEVRATRYGLEMIHPEWREVKPGESLDLTQSLTPIYPTTKGLQQTSLRKLISQVLAALTQETISLEEYLPQNLLEQFQFPSLKEALFFLHAPPINADQALLLNGSHPMQQRLAFEELLAHHLALLELRARVQIYPAAPLTALKLQAQLQQDLSFQLTFAQQRVWREIQADLAMPKPMLRLVQGDVGSGKTILAALAILQTVDSGFQAALMAPTELLAEQHLQSLRKWFDPYGVKVALLSGSLSRKERQLVLHEVAQGNINVVVGTHALIQAGVEFASLKLLVIDEQHRFGVHHRLALKQKGEQAGFYPHQLIMTATPIPRTLAMTAYADLDSSIIDELPPGRQGITTVLVANSRRPETIERLRQHCQQKQQAYWVCTLIAESELLQCQAAEVTAAQLQQALP
ncbi:MAG TPA: ATP-dependent DNA helicase RecG, partial [Coxiellaceae bacterium]|nr:ATP-dependent DNA helicase RecG [Coxiellaceae bacterium]